MRNNIIAVLDLGSSKIVCLIAEIGENNQMFVKGIGHQISVGIKAGVIIDIKRAEKAILNAVSAAEEMAGETIDEVIVNVSGMSLVSHHLNVETNISGQEVTEQDIGEISAIGVEHFKESEAEILHCFPTFFTIDDSNGITDPRGMYGNVLSTTLHLVTCSKTHLRNVANCLARCHLNIREVICTPYASALSCLTEDERQLGATIIDIGGGNLSIAIFSQGNFVHCTSLPVGGGHITRDIAIGLSLDSALAERVKVLYGSAIATSSDHHVFIDVDRESDSEPQSQGMYDYAEREFPKASLTSIIRPRIEEMMDLANQKLCDEGMDNIIGSKVVLTGGGSQLTGLKELASHYFKRQVRIAKPQVIEGMAESMRGSAFSTPVGMLMSGMYKLQNSKGRSSNLPEDANYDSGYISKMKNWFKAAANE